ncbi:MAG: acyloxyacyl hydrolase [Bacteroides sp.]|nr:acyloxyacyl hydrolase [Bacteroides sp.]MCI1681376.1 acyloxyacyl hydrolase [Bacteroides sp.]
MRNNIQARIFTFLLALLLSFSDTPLLKGQTVESVPENQLKDSLATSSHFIHSFSMEVHDGYIFPTKSFFNRDNELSKNINNSFSTHFKYAFQFRPNTLPGKIYGEPYQGIGLAYHMFGDKEELGNPITFYLFQGATLGHLSPRISLNYEWNLGLSTGWKPYDLYENPYNKIIGSKVNAYIDLNFYLRWKLSRYFDLNSGIAFNHFSNGNTDYPNAGLNTAELKIGLVYNFNRTESTPAKPRYLLSPVPLFPRHISYDLVLFGSWKRKGVQFGDEQVLAPDKYTVLGFNFAPMYNFGYRFRAGVSLDGTYDSSANVYTEDYIGGTEQEFFKPAFNRQVALGLSGRAEYVMPYFSINAGLGVNVFHKGHDLNDVYQILALKIKMTRNTFLHIGYSIKNFHNPNHLMLGIGFRFNNKYPSIH